MSFCLNELSNMDLTYKFLSNQRSIGTIVWGKKKLLKNCWICEHFQLCDEGNFFLREGYEFSGQVVCQAAGFSKVLLGPGGRFKNTYELLNQRALKFSYVNKIHIFQCMGKIFCVEFQRYPLKFHTKYLTHTLKDMIFMQFWNFKSS